MRDPTTLPRVSRDDLTFLDDDGPAILDGAPFTGVAVERWPDGTVRAEKGYELGFEHYFHREYNADGVLVMDVPYDHGGAHGIARDYYDSGKLARERLIKWATVLWRKDYDEDGRVVDEYHLPEDDFRFQRVRKLEAESGG